LKWQLQLQKATSTLLCAWKEKRRKRREKKLRKTRGSLELSHEKEKLTEALELPKERVNDLIDKVIELMLREKSKSIVIEKLWNDKTLSNNEVVFAVMFIGYFIAALEKKPVAIELHAPGSDYIAW